MAMDPLASPSLSLARHLMSSRCVSPQVSELLPRRLSLSSCAAVCGLKFGPDQEKLCVFDEDGHVLIYDPSDAKVQWKGHSSAVYDVCWAQSDTLATASADRSVRVWRLADSGQSSLLFDQKTHSESVKVVDWQPLNNSVYASGSKDDSIHLVDIRQRRPLTNALRQVHCASSHSFSAAKGVTGMRFLSESMLLSCGASDGRLKLWDLRRSHINYKGSARPTEIFQHPGTSSKQGFACLVTNKSASLAYVSCLDSMIYRFQLNCSFDRNDDERSRPDMAFEGANINDFFMRLALSPDEDYLVSGSAEDSGCPVWNCGTSHVLKATEKQFRRGYESFIVRPVAKLITSSDVSSLAWSRQNGSIATYEESLEVLLKWTPRWMQDGRKNLTNVSNEGSVTLLLPPKKTNIRNVYRARDDWLMNQRQPFTPIEVNIFNSLSPTKLRSPTKRLRIKTLTTPTDHLPNLIRDQTTLSKNDCITKESQETPLKRPRALNWLESLSLSKSVEKKGSEQELKKRGTKRRRSCENEARQRLAKK